METKQKIDLRKKLSLIDAHIRIGKNGINEGIINEINKLLKKYKLVKIKILKAALPIEKSALNKLAVDTQSEIIENKGNTLSLYKR